MEEDDRLWQHVTALSGLRSTLLLAMPAEERYPVSACREDFVYLRGQSHIYMQHH